MKQRRYITGLLLMFLACTSYAQELTSFMSDMAYYPLKRSDLRYEMQSSYDRTGGNDDGFNGTYSVIRKENGNSVIAETEGAGMITRIWFPYNAGYPNGPMFLIDKKIYIYLDGADTPSLEMPVIDLYNGMNANFFNPLCNIAMGGCCSLMPIPFNKGAKVMVEGDRAGFIQVQFTKFPQAGKYPTYQYKDKLFDDKVKQQMIRRYYHDGKVQYLGISNSTSFSKKYKLHKGKNKITLPSGPTTLRAFLVNASGIELYKFLQGNLSIYWDKEDEASVQVPLSMFFLQEENGVKGRSWLAGLQPGGRGVYNFLPMPYQKEARVVLDMTDDCEVTIQLVSQNGTSDGGYLCVDHHKEEQTTPGKRFKWLDVAGEGHYVGLYMRAAGDSYHENNAGYSWTGCLEGDEIFEVDGKMVSHGTGTEDYFNVGWNGMFGRLDHAEMFPFHGYTLYDCTTERSYTAAYRWHLPTEVIPFRKSLKASIEVGPTDDQIGSYECAAFYYLFK